MATRHTEYRPTWRTKQMKELFEAISSLENYREVEDFFRDLWPTGADTVFFSYILHDWSPETCRDLLRKAARILPPGGLLILRELFRDDDGPGPLQAAIGSAVRGDWPSVRPQAPLPQVPSRRDEAKRLGTKVHEPPANRCGAA